MKVKVENSVFEMLQNGSSYENMRNITIRMLSSDPTAIDTVFSHNQIFTIMFDNGSETSIEYENVHCVYLYHNQEIGITYDSENDKYVKRYEDIVIISLIK